MASTTAKKKTTLAEAASKVSGEYPDIFSCAHEKMLFEADFRLLVQTFVTESAGGGPLLDSVKKRRFDEVQSRKMTKKYDAKAKAAGRPILVKRAEEEAVGRDLDDINKEALAQMASFNLTPDQMQELLKYAANKIWPGH